MSHDSTIDHLSTGTPDSFKHGIANKFSVAALYFSEEDTRCADVPSADDESLIQLCHPPSSVSCGASTSATPSAHNPQSNTTSQGDHTSSSCFYEFPECEEVESNAGVSKYPSVPSSLLPAASPMLEDEESDHHCKSTWSLSHPHITALPNHTHVWINEPPSTNRIGSETVTSPSSITSRTLQLEKRPSSRLHESDTPYNATHGSVKRRRSRTHKNSSCEPRASKRSTPPCDDVASNSSSILPPITVQLPQTNSSGRLLMRLKRSSLNSDCFQVEIPPPAAGEVDCCSLNCPNSPNESHLPKTERLFVIDSGLSATTPSVDSAPLSIATSTSFELTQSEDCSRTQDKGMVSCHLPDGREFTVGDIVWAKISGYPYWPSKIIRITETEVPIPVPSRGRRGRGRGGVQRMSNTTLPGSRAGYVREYRCCVDWLAWKQFSYISCDKLFHFEEHFHKKYSPKNTKKHYAQAVKEAQSIVASRKANATSTPSCVASCPSQCSSSTHNPLVNNVDTKHASPDSIRLVAASTPSLNEPLYFPPTDISASHSDVYSTSLSSMMCAPLPQDSDVSMLTPFWNPLDLPELSGQLFDEPSSGLCNALEFSDDEEISYRKAITNLALNL